MSTFDLVSALSSRVGCVIRVHAMQGKMTGTDFVDGATFVARERMRYESSDFDAVVPFATGALVISINEFQSLLV